jgi:hypothetical protein
MPLKDTIPFAEAPWTLPASVCTVSWLKAEAVINRAWATTRTPKRMLFIDFSCDLQCWKSENELLLSSSRDGCEPQLFERIEIYQAGGCISLK